MLFAFECCLYLLLACPFPLFSIVFRQPATSALAGIAIWLFLTLFAVFLIGMIADAIYPVTSTSDTEQVVANIRLNMLLGRFTPNVLYEQAVITLLNPSVRALRRCHV